MSFQRNHTTKLNIVRNICLVYYGTESQMVFSLAGFITLWEGFFQFDAAPRRIFPISLQCCGNLMKDRRGYLTKRGVSFVTVSRKYISVEKSWWLICLFQWQLLFWVSFSKPNQQPPKLHCPLRLIRCLGSDSEKRPRWCGHCVIQIREEVFW